VEFEECQLSYSKIGSIPVGGRSLPIKISLDFGLFDKSFFQFSKVEMYQTSVNIIPQTLTINPGENEAFFHVEIRLNSRDSMGFIRANVVSDYSLIFPEGLR